jgi:hypothetical protein
MSLLFVQRSHPTILEKGKECRKRKAESEATDGPSNQVARQYSVMLMPSGSGVVSQEKVDKLITNFV